MKVYNDYFGQFGGRYAAEVLRTPLDELQAAFTEAIADPDFLAELDRFGRQFVGRPTPLSSAVNASAEIGGAAHLPEAGGAGQYRGAQGQQRHRPVPAGQAHGQATGDRRNRRRPARRGHGRGRRQAGAGGAGSTWARWTCAASVPTCSGWSCSGAEVVPVGSGSRTLKDAINEALRDWSDTFDRTHYVIGSVMGPSPYPDMVREFQSVVGREVAEQWRQLGVQPAALIACVGGGSNALGFFAPHLEASAPRLIGVEAGGRGSGLGDHAARMSGSGVPGIVHGYKSLFLTDGDGQVLETHSISAGLDYPGVGPQLAHLGTSGRVEFTTASDDEALDAVRLFARTEGIIFALESAHAGAAAMKVARTLPDDASVVVNVSGRGDKDLFILAGALQPERWAEFLTREAREIQHG